MKPTIGRIVHFVINEGKVVPAIITAVNGNDCVNLRLFLDKPPDPTEWIFHSVQDESEKPLIRTWHWPPRS